MPHAACHTDVIAHRFQFRVWLRALNVNLTKIGKKHDQKCTSPFLIGIGGVLIALAALFVPQPQQPETILHLHEIHKSNPFQSEHVLRAGAKNKRKSAESADILRNHLPIGTRTSRRNRYKLYRKLMLTQHTHTDGGGIQITMVWRYGATGEQKNGQTNKSKNSNSHVRCAVVVVGAARGDCYTFRTPHRR